MGIRCADHVTPLSPQKLALTSPTGGGRSVGIVRSRTKATEFFLGIYIYIYIYSAIHKSLRDFRPLRYSSRDGHAEGEHFGGGRNIPSFSPTFHVLDMSTLGDAADVNPVIKFLSHTRATYVAGT